MKAVSAVLISLAASAMAMPPPQRLERRLAVTDDELSSFRDGCPKADITAREACEKGDDHKIDCVEECSELAVQGVEDCMDAKDNTKKVPECQRAQLDTYLQCTLAGPVTPMTAQDTEYNGIWRETCTKPSQEAYEECRKIEQDEGNKCEHERNGNKCEHERTDNEMQCLLDNTKARAESSFVHNSCSAPAIANMNDCFYHNNKGKMLQQCQREQWNAYPECVKKHAPQNGTATEPAKDACKSTS